MSDNKKQPPEEKDVFNVLEMDYLEPGKRDNSKNWERYANR